jgi:amidohydrolase
MAVVEPGGPVDPKLAAESNYEAVVADLHELSHWMYENPERAYEEYRTSERIADLLAANGFTVTRPAWGLATAFDAVTGAGGPEVVICAEYDALPEVGHACGHNLIAAAACGAGIALAPLADALGFRVRVLGTPAEETFGGKVDLIDAGAFAGVAAALMVHPATSDVVDPAVLAVAHLDVDFHGKESHAAFAPHLGINALDAAVQAYVNVSTLRQALIPTDKVHGVITYGGGAPNVIPAHTQMAWYVRAATTQRLDELIERVEACFHAAAAATGCDVEITPRGHTYRDLVSNPVLLDLYTANSEQLGRPMRRAEFADSLAAGSTDMGNVSHVVPSLHPMLSIDSLPAVNHQREFAAHTLSPAGQRSIRDGALAMAWTIIDLAEGQRWAELR